MLLGPDPEKMIKYVKNDLGRIQTLQSNRPIHKTYMRFLNSLLTTCGKPEVAQACYFPKFHRFPLSYAMTETTELALTWSNILVKKNEELSGDVNLCSVKYSCVSVALNPK